MRPQELIDLISEGESTTLEFKRQATTPTKIAKEISAFANTKGGYLLVGIDDDGTIVGVKSEKSEVDLIESACEFNITPPIEPEIEIVNVHNSEIVVAYIHQSKTKPHSMVSDDNPKAKGKKRAYIRVGEKSVISSPEMYRLMGYQNPDSQPVRLILGDKEQRLLAYLEKYERITINEFSRLVNISRRRAERLMIRLVRAGVVQIHNDANYDYFSLA